MSGLLMSLAPGVTAAPKGFGCSACGLGAGFAAVGETGPELPVGGFEPEENFELMLDIHEFRLLGEC